MPGLINYLQVQPSADGRSWHWVRRWPKAEVGGVRFYPLGQPQQIANLAWQAMPEDPWRGEEEWTLPLAVNVTNEPTLTSLEQLAVELEPFRHSTARPLSDDLANQLDSLLRRLAEFVAECARQNRAVGFFTPGSVFHVGKSHVGNGKLLLPDFGFVWDSELVPVIPPWLREDAFSEFEFWDLSPLEINNHMKDQAGTSVVQSHDVRVLARIIAVVLLGSNQLVAASPGGGGLRIPDGDRMPKTRRSALFRLLVDIVNNRANVPAERLAQTLREHPPSDFFRPPPPRPPLPWKRIIAWTTISAILIMGAVLGWQNRDLVFPPPPPPPRLCPDCPGASLLREPADKLADIWDKTPSPDVKQLEEEFRVLKQAADQERSLDFPDAEIACLGILAGRFELRVGRVADELVAQFLDHPPTSDQACQRLTQIRLLSSGLDSLTRDHQLTLPENQDSASGWRAAIERLAKQYQCP